MKQYLNKTCKVQINYKGRDLYYLARVTGVDDTHIHFTDKHGVPYSFARKYVMQVSACSKIV